MIMRQQEDIQELDSLEPTPEMDDEIRAFIAVEANKRQRKRYPLMLVGPLAACIGALFSFVVITAITPDGQKILATDIDLSAIKVTLRGSDASQNTIDVSRLSESELKAALSQLVAAEQWEEASKLAQYIEQQNN